MAKNARGAGSIRQRPDGRWEARVSVGFHPGTGRQIQRSVYGKTQKEVRQKLTQIVLELDQGTYVAPSKLTLSTWLNTWLSDYTSHVKPHTLKAYQDRIRLYVIPALGAVKLTDLTPPMVQRFINDLNKGTRRKTPLSPKTIKNVHGVLHRALVQAVMIGYIRSNPADHCTLPRIVKPDIKPLDDAMIVQFMKAVEGEPFEELFLITLFTGLRQGEVLGLQWSNVDFEHGLLTVKQQLQREKKAGGCYYLTSLKNGKTRTLCLPPFVLDLFRKRKEKQEEERQGAYDLWQEDIPGLVFETLMGGHVSHTTVRGHFKRIVKQLGIPETRFHDLRHSFAVASLQNGDDLKTLQENLGHHAAGFTLDTYGHITSQMRQASAQRMEDYITRLKQ